MSHDLRDGPNRREFLSGLVLGAAALGCRDDSPPNKGPAVTSPQAVSSSERLPVVFVGHGSPMNAIEDNRWSRSFRELGQRLPEPRAVLAVSAHWYVPGTFVTGNSRPETIHDFGGFPPALHEVSYPAPGDPELAERIQKLLAARGASVRSDWGLDHGTWSVLVHLRPKADIPVLQLSIDARLPPLGHVELGRALAPLREEGVLILASGNIVHNLRDAFTNMRQGRTETPRWASEFDQSVATALTQRDAGYLSRVLESDAGRQAHPTAEHYLPLLYTLGASSPGDALTYPVEGFDAGSLSMRSVLFS